MLTCRQVCALFGIRFAGATRELLSRQWQWIASETDGTVEAAALCFRSGERVRGGLRGLLPAGTVVAHKTGTAATIKGLNRATNDVGVITLPGNTGQFAIAVYMKASTRDEAARDRVIARMARTAYDYWAA